MAFERRCCLLRTAYSEASGTTGSAVDADGFPGWVLKSTKPLVEP